IGRWMFYLYPNTHRPANIVPMVEVNPRVAEFVRRGRLLGGGRIFDYILQLHSTIQFGVLSPTPRTFILFLIISAPFFCQIYNFLIQGGLSFVGGGEDGACFFCPFFSRVITAPLIRVFSLSPSRSSTIHPRFRRFPQPPQRVSHSGLHVIHQ